MKTESEELVANVKEEFGLRESARIGTDTAGAVLEEKSGLSTEKEQKVVKRTSARIKARKKGGSVTVKVKRPSSGRAGTRKRTKLAESTGEAVTSITEGEASVSSSRSMRKRKSSLKINPEDEIMLTNPVAQEVLEAGAGSGKMLGAHISVAGGLERGFYNALSIGCRSFAFFVRNQHRWNSKPMKDEVVEAFRQTAQELKFPMDQIVVHGSYLINCGSSDMELLERARECMLDECKRCEKLGVIYYNIHPGSTAGKCTREECIRTIAASLDYVMDRTQYLTILIETMAGQGNTIGGKFEEIQQIIDLVKNKKRVGVCIDTCHIFAAGYDIRSKERYEETIAKFDNTVGLQYLRAFHINDSLGDLGSKVDRHANIDKGKLKLVAFRNLIADPRFDGLPMILETPAGDYAGEMIQMYGSLKNESLKAQKDIKSFFSPT